LLTFPFAAQRADASRVVPQNDPGGRGSAAYCEASLEFKAAAESHAAPYDNFISQLTSDCESELGRDLSVDLG